MIKDIEYLFKKIFLSEKYLLKKRLNRAIKNNYEKELYIIDNLKDENKEAIDVGVYRGVYTYKLAKNFKHVHSFEPNPMLYTYLKRYLSQVVSNITLYNCALSNKNEFTNLKVPLRRKSFFSLSKKSDLREAASNLYKTLRKIKKKVLDQFNLQKYLITVLVLQ